MGERRLPAAVFSCCCCFFSRCCFPTLPCFRSPSSCSAAAAAASSSDAADAEDSALRFCRRSVVCRCGSKESCFCTLSPFFPSPPKKNQQKQQINQTTGPFAREREREREREKARDSMRQMREKEREFFFPFVLEFSFFLLLQKNNNREIKKHPLFKFCREPTASAGEPPSPCPRSSQPPAARS